MDESVSTVVVTEAVAAIGMVDRRSDPQEGITFVPGADITIDEHKLVSSAYVSTPSEFASSQLVRSDDQLTSIQVYGKYLAAHHARSKANIPLIAPNTMEKFQ